MKLYAVGTQRDTIEYNSDLKAAKKLANQHGLHVYEVVSNGTLKFIA